LSGWPLQSIIDDQISEARNMGLSATSTAGLTYELRAGIISAKTSSSHV